MFVETAFFFFSTLYFCVTSPRNLSKDNPEIKGCLEAVSPGAFVWAKVLHRLDLILEMKTKDFLCKRRDSRSLSLLNSHVAEDKHAVFTL